MSTVLGEVVYADPTSIEKDVLVLGGQPKAPPQPAAKPGDAKAGGARPRKMQPKAAPAAPAAPAAAAPPRRGRVRRRRQGGGRAETFEGGHAGGEGRGGRQQSVPDPGGDGGPFGPAAGRRRHAAGRPRSSPARPAAGAAQAEGEDPAR